MTSTPAITSSTRSTNSGTSREQDLAEPMVDSEHQRQFGIAKRDTLPRMCRECDVRFACNGECPKHRFLTTPDGETGLNYLCAGYKHFFHHIDPYMQFMSAELRAGRPPANIMRFVGPSASNRCRIKTAVQNCHSGVAKACHHVRRTRVSGCARVGIVGPGKQDGYAGLRRHAYATTMAGN